MLDDKANNERLIVNILTKTLENLQACCTNADRCANDVFFAIFNIRSFRFMPKIACFVQGQLVVLRYVKLFNQR